jgi:replicative DNA helicase
VRAKYLAIKNGATGVPFPWSKLNIETLGMWPEDLILFVARTSVGKTWALILTGLHAWEKGYKVLFVTTEMRVLAVQQRLMAMKLKLPYEMFRKGMLHPNDEKALEEAIEELEGKEGFDIIGGDFDFRLESVDAAIEDSDPALTLVDGAYLLEAPGRNRTEKAAYVFNALKRSAKRHQIPIVVTTQFNRSAKKSKADSNALENIGLTDVAGWNADMAFALYQTKDQKQGKKLGVKPMKTREAVIRKFEVNWDLDLMNFTDIAGGGDADETGIDDDEDPCF